MDIIKSLLKNKERARLIYNKETNEILGLFSDWRKENPDENVGMCSIYGTFNIGDVSSIYKYEIEAIKSLGLLDIHKEMIERTSVSKTKRRAKAEKLAEPILDKVYNEIMSILDENKCHIAYHMDGDTHGIYDDYQYISICVDGFSFERRI